MRGGLLLFTSPINTYRLCDIRSILNLVVFWKNADGSPVLGIPALSCGVRVL